MSPVSALPRDRRQERGKRQTDGSRQLASALEVLLNICSLPGVPLLLEREPSINSPAPRGAVRLLCRTTQHATLPQHSPTANGLEGFSWETCLPQLSLRSSAMPRVAARPCHGDTRTFQVLGSLLTAGAPTGAAQPAPSHPCSFHILSAGSLISSARQACPAPSCPPSTAPRGAVTMPNPGSGMRADPSHQHPCPSPPTQSRIIFFPRISTGKWL